MHLQTKNFSILTLLIGLLLAIGQNSEAWQMPPHQFSAIGGGMDMASDANGNAVVVLDNGGSIEALFYSRAANAWSDPTLLGTVNSPSRVRVGMDQSGKALAIWADNGSTAGTELHSSYFNGTAWFTESPDPFAAPASICSFGLNMNGPDTALATWIDHTLNAVCCSFFNKGSWSQPTRIASTDGDQLSVAYSTNGSAVVGFVNGPLGHAINYIGGIWREPVTLNPEPHLCDHNIVVGIDAMGKALAVWMGTDRWDIWAASFDGLKWLSPKIISGDYHSNLCHGNSIGMTPDGRAVAIWTGDDLDRSPWRGFSSTYDGKSWSKPQKFTDYALWTNVSVNSKGDALLLYYNPSSQLLSAKLPFGGIWTTPEILYSPYAESKEIWSLIMVPILCDDGFALAGWGKGSSKTIKYFSTTENRPIAPEKVLQD